MWVKLKEGQTINAIIDFSSVQSVAKHWTGKRSELCLSKGCPYCLAGIPKRWRYQARLIVEGETLQWEFGEEVMTHLSTIPHNINWARITITRLGEGRKTKYQIASQSEAKQESEEGQQPLPIVNKFTRGKYGHIVKY